jgi:hypothetical protein
VEALENLYADNVIHMAMQALFAVLEFDELRPLDGENERARAWV